MQPISLARFSLSLASSTSSLAPDTVPASSKAILPPYTAAQRTSRLRSIQTAGKDPQRHNILSHLLSSMLTIFHSHSINYNKNATGAFNVITSFLKNQGF
jgi:hypothetical protein